MGSIVRVLVILLVPAVAAGQASVWTQVEPGSPDGRQAHAVAYDSGRGRTVLFGGIIGPLNGGVPLGDTWEWDGQTWTAVATGDPTVATHPSARFGVAMAFDAKRQRVVLFGGKDAQGNTLGDTWEWDGKTWARMSTTGPPARSLHALAFDTTAQQVLLFGGVDAGVVYLGDTWRWTGTAWQQVAVTGPSARQGPAMTSDAARKVVVLHGGLGTGATGVTVFGDTWEWNGASWSDKTPATGPGPLYAPALVYDAAGQRTLLFGGLANNFLVRADTWSWNGTSWTKLAVFGPAARYQFAADYDAMRGQVVLFAGGDSASRTLADTWEFDGTLWLRRNFRAPGPRTGHGAAFDEIEQSTIVFGGAGYSGLLGDTWAWSGNSWAKVATTGPTARSNPAMAYDEISGRVVLFGGAGASAQNDTWEWDAGWTQRCAVGACPLAPPSRRSGAALAFDDNRQKVVLFGGENAGAPIGDTWEWDTVADRWTQLATTGPSARAHHALAADRVRQRIVLFGGRAAGGAVLGDTWEWDGASWAQIPTAQAPPARSRHGLAYDRIRDRVVLYGGIDGGGKPLLDMWEWNGATWRLVIWNDPIPRERSGHALVYDALRRHLVLFGGSSAASKLVADTWENFSLGAPCQKAEECHLGFCVDGVCCENACDGTCRRCDLPAPAAARFEYVVLAEDGTLLSNPSHDGICRQIPAGQPDVDNCPGETYPFVFPGFDSPTFTCRGTCNAQGQCSGDFVHERCSKCLYCNAYTGRCEDRPPDGKDPECDSPARCHLLSNWSYGCRTYRDIGAGQCHARHCYDWFLEEDFLREVCTDYTNAPDGKECGQTSICCEGECTGTCRCGDFVRDDGTRCTDFYHSFIGVCSEGECVKPGSCSASSGSEPRALPAGSLPLLLAGCLCVWLVGRTMRRRR